MCEIAAPIGHGKFVAAATAEDVFSSAGFLALLLGAGVPALDATPSSDVRVGLNVDALTGLKP